MASEQPAPVTSSTNTDSSTNTESSTNTNSPANVNTATNTDSETFTLTIISPTVGVPQPLVLQELSVDTTVKQLKEKIRNAVGTKPTDQAQRLIHAGRLLSRDTETMAEVFGRESLRSSLPSVLHLVVRDTSDTRTNTTSTHTASQTPTSSQPAAFQVPPQYQTHSRLQQPLGQQQQHQPQNPANPFQLPHQVRIGGAQHHAVPFGFPQGSIPGLGAAPTNPMQNVPSGLTPLQYNQWMRAVGAQMNQRAPTQAGQETPNTNGRGTSGTNNSGRTASPFQIDGTRTTVRESTGPNGIQWRITVNEAFMNPPQRPARTGSPLATASDPSHAGTQPRSTPNGGQLSNNDVQSVLRGADASSATRVIADAMRRNASSSSLASLSANQAQHPIPPGVTTPLNPSRAGSAAGSATGTPDPLRARGRSRGAATNQPQVQSTQGTLEVYILSSPDGPRALLLNGNIDAYYTPPARTANQSFGMPFPQRPTLPLTLVGGGFNPNHLTPTPTLHPQLSPIGNPNTQTNNTNQPQPQAQPQPPQQQQHQQPQQIPPQLGHAVARPDNARVLVFRLAQLRPHIWMVIRLGFFIWWFTSPNSSWSRWFTVISIAIILFFVNTGFLNPVAEQVWIPVRRHLENLIPHADGHRRAPAGAGNAQGANGEAAEPGRQGELHPADTAARLVQQRRHANANWLMDVARRLERAGILFLASIAPGVAERHIAQIEAEVRAERRRREAEAEASIAANSRPDQQEGAEQNHENTESGNEPAHATTALAEEPNEQQPAEGETGNERRNERRNERQQPAAQEPLIAL